jgi:ribosomal protein L21
MAFAIIKTGGRQYRVAEGDTIDVDLLDAEAGKQVVLADVLMHADGENVTHGAPIDGAKVTAEVVEQRKDKKVVAYKFRRRKGYHRTVGHRRKLTRLKIKSISVGGKKSAKKRSGIGSRMAHKKGQGSVKNGRDSVSKRLGVKKFGASWLSPVTLSSDNGEQNFCRGRMSDLVATIPFLRWSMGMCASIGRAGE